jgi:hypothetical protein
MERYKRGKREREKGRKREGGGEKGGSGRYNVQISAKHLLPAYCRPRS